MDLFAYMERRVGLNMFVYPSMQERALFRCQSQCLARDFRRPRLGAGTGESGVGIEAVSEEQEQV